jgi:hypothetical protein
MYTPDHRGIGALLRGPEIRSLVTEKAEIAVALYRSKVKRRTGENARDVRIHTEIGADRHGGRWTAVVTAYAPHAAAREFGNRKNRNPEHVLRDVAQEMDES